MHTLAEPCPWPEGTTPCLVLVGLVVQLTGAWEQSIRGCCCPWTPEGSRVLRTKALIPPQLEAPACSLLPLRAPAPRPEQGTLLLSCLPWPRT